MSVLLELAERCEKATRPDRELDIDICLATRQYSERALSHWRHMQPKGSAERSVREFLSDRLSTSYTGSIDAARTLVPDGCDWAIYKSNDGYTGECSEYAMSAKMPGAALSGAALIYLAEESALSRSVGREG
jgi:hypothetical protein